jgi:histidinol-phosphate aminotransferase
MIEAKEQIRCLDRVDADSDNRLSYLRLDKNEFVGKISKDVYKSALSKINLEKITMYPEYIKLKEEISEIEGLKPENVIIGNGSDIIIKNIFESYIDINHDVLLTDPTFAMYPIYCKMFEAGFKPQVQYKLLTEFPKEEFMKKLESIDSDTLKMAVIVNPNNPTGCIVDNRFMLKATEIASQKNVIMLIDEAYHYYYKKTMANYVNDFDNLIVLRTFSKFFGLAGLRIGFGLSNSNIIETLRKVQVTYPVDCISVAFAQEVLNDPKI